LESGIDIFEDILNSLGKITDEYLEKENIRGHSLNWVRKVNDIESRIEIFSDNAILNRIEHYWDYWKTKGVMVNGKNSNITKYLIRNEFEERKKVYNNLKKIYQENSELVDSFSSPEDLMIGYSLKADKPDYFFMSKRRILMFRMLLPKARPMVAKKLKRPT